jgi:hypothetical protein
VRGRERRQRLILAALGLACDGDGSGGAVCATTPCVDDAATLLWEAPPESMAVGNDLARWGDTLFVGAPGVQQDPPPIYLAPRVTAVALPTMETMGSWSTKTFVDATGYSVAVTDLDQDGVPEVAIGAPNRQPGQDITGSVFLVSGVPQADLRANVEADLTFSSADDVRAGLSVAFADLLEGGGAQLLASGSGQVGQVPEDGGAVYVIDPALRGQLYDDDASVIIRGAPGVGQSVNAWDADRDGSTDLVASLPYSAGVGWFAGPLARGELSDGDASGSWTGPANHCSCFGDFIETLGDLTGDGAVDLAFSAPTWDSDPPERTGRAYVVPAGDLQHGPADDLSIQVRGTELGEGVGYGLASGDLDGDGQHDLLVGAPGVYPGVWPGKLMAFPGPVAGVLGADDAFAVLYGGRDFDQLGRSILTFDADGDAQDDVIVSAIGLDEGRGGLYLVPGAVLVPGPGGQ